MRKKILLIQSVALVVCVFVSLINLSTVSGSTAPNDPGILEPLLTELNGVETRIPNTDQADGDQLLNVVGPIVVNDAKGALSLTGHPITDIESPNRAMRNALNDLYDTAIINDHFGMHTAAQELNNILLGTTEGRIYDGFSMLNFNRGAFVSDHEPGEYKMKALRDSGETAISIDGQPHTIWEVDVNYLWYDGQFDSDTFLLRVPFVADQFDLLRIHFKIYSLVREDFAPTTVMMDHRAPGSVQFPFKGFDSVWTKVNNNTVTEITVDFPPLKLLRGIYTWGWRIHPPRIQFLQPIYEIENFHTKAIELEPQGKSFAERNRGLTIDDIGDAAPEKKMYQVVQAVFAGKPPSKIARMLERNNVAPLGTWLEWVNLAEKQNQLPPEAWDILAREGIEEGEFGPYRFVTAYVNNEMYGTGPDGNKIEGWNQGDQFSVKIINLDKHTHYFRNVDFGPKLHDDIANGSFPAGSHSFEIMNFKPTYGAPKVAEMQWRAGWGFRPHFDVIHQQDVFYRLSDNVLTKRFFDGKGNPNFGYQYSEAVRGGDFVFNPPPFIIGSEDEPSPFRLREDNGADGLVIGQLTEGYGVAKMCSESDFPLGGFCARDLSTHNPHGVRNVDTNGDEIPDELWFPPFLRNPNSNGGDIIPPTPAWKPFLWINPNNGSLLIDPSDPSKGYWADLTYSHGRPIPVGQGVTINIESSRASAQLFYQFDDLFHDNAIFSPHPTFSAEP
jgi:hypothetical protein